MVPPKREHSNKREWRQALQCDHKTQCLSSTLPKAEKNQRMANTRLQTLIRQVKRRCPLRPQCLECRRQIHTPAQDEGIAIMWRARLRMCVCASTCARVCTLASACAPRVCTCVCACVCACPCTRTCVRALRCAVHARKHTHPYCVCVCMCICVHNEQPIPIGT